MCDACQNAKVEENAAKAGLAGSVVEHLGKAYPYEEWYGAECQYCKTDYELEMVFAKSDRR